MHIHILGICGTFMGSLALLARELGHTVTGSDTAIYPPMSTQLQHAGIEILEGYKAKHLQPAPDLVVVGNACKRGMEAVEYMLDARLPYTSGPQFLAEQVLQYRHVLAVAGTHGKTTTTTMLAWILQYAGIDTGFLIGGVPQIGTDDERLRSAFAHSSYLGKDYFVIEADEYDSAFFDKRSKFVHYRPTTAILNNLEYDHADIFPDLKAIQTQFHHMIRMIPSSGQIIMPANTQSLEELLNMGIWTPVVRTSLSKDENNHAILHQEDGSSFGITIGDATGVVNWGMSGLHNVHNALVAISAAHHIGVNVAMACKALSNFGGIKRRMELIGDINGMQIYDDFAHHPTAIATTLDGAKKKLHGRKIWAVIEPRSNTMKLGKHRDLLAPSAALADHVLWYEPADLAWGLADTIGNSSNQLVLTSTDDIINHLVSNAHTNDVIIIMSNGGFENIHTRLLMALQSKKPK
ncbi:UDP-N-acetylmuramate:L-alanyl-gamma-D-glutamyl-meso-diaminopimelate ligase [Moraxella sp. Pampa]|uniref:UDP-N-acetylmuramate:L-alanyl-gamma-D-glutamyl- meso-diaminopimelate ligase n=1 Tax=Moraxella sp. Pampa TaxID=3111978 RepID=UPI002B404A1A|nr:UDP-N-acetylmuramate:L-alanyl-gamma-D-glutamyl-meso-diaminopimelate ligase [Moraxella sp. Pampa]